MKSELDLWYEMWDRAGSQGLDTWYELPGRVRGEDEPSSVRAPSVDGLESACRRNRAVVVTRVNSDRRCS